MYQAAVFRRVSSENGIWGNRLPFNCVTLSIALSHSHLPTGVPRSGFRGPLGRTMQGLGSANEIFSVQSLLSRVPPHFIIQRVAPSRPAPRSGFSQPPTLYLHLSGARLTFSACVTGYFHLYKVFIFNRLPALSPLAIRCQVWNGSHSNFMTAPGERKGQEEIIRRSIFTWPLSE